MSNITELSKTELLHFIYYNVENFSITHSIVECAACGNNNKADFYYICDECNESLSKE